MERYEIVTNIGKGSSGSVFLAKSRKLKKLVAIKEIEIDENRRSRCKKSVIREASILKRLSHRSIVECYEWFLSKNDTLMHIVLEYCGGGTMQDKVKMAQSRKEYLAEHKVLKWIADITSAVAYMHERKILHRDLKTENVFLVKPEIAKLGDFGISKEIDHTLDLAQTCVGTPCYLSPELCQDIPYNSKSDIWALGCLLFEIAALKPAFDAANLVSLFYKIVKGDFATLPDGCPENVSVLVKLILQKDPDQRPTAADLLKHPILSTYLAAAERPGSISRGANDTGKQKPPKLAELRNKHGAVEKFNSRDMQDTVKDGTNDRTISPGPGYAYNMFLSGVKSKSTLQNTTNNKPPSSDMRSNSVLEKNADAVSKKSLVLPPLFGTKEVPNTEESLDTACEVETARPQTCPHSASRRVAEDHSEETFTDTVVTWSGYGDRGSRHPSGHVRQRTSLSFSSDSDVLSSSDSDAQCETARSRNFQDGSLQRSRKYSDSDSSRNEDSDEIAEDFIRDEPIGDDEIPEMIETGGDADEMTLNSARNGELRPLGDSARVLPGSAWLRSKRIQVMQQSGVPASGAGDNVNHGRRKKARLPGSSWLSRGQRDRRQESSDEAIVLGEQTNEVQADRVTYKPNSKNRRNHDLPGSAWLKKSNPAQKMTDSNKTNKPKRATRGKSMILESCSSSTSEMSSPEKRHTDSDPDATNYSYPDDFDDYEDDFEPSDEESDGEADTSITKSSLNVVRQGCIDLLGDEMYKDLSSLFQRGLTLSEVMHKFKKRKVDSETVESCYLLLQKLP